VNYWECRSEVFGAEKYLLPMTLSGALHDDLDALEAGVYCLLPQTDLSGRQLLYLDPARHTREGYTSESLVSCPVDVLLLFYELNSRALFAYLFLPLASSDLVCH